MPTIISDLTWTTLRLWLPFKFPLSAFREILIIWGHSIWGQLLGIQIVRAHFYHDKNLLWTWKDIKDHVGWITSRGSHKNLTVAGSQKCSEETWAADGNRFVGDSQSPQATSQVYAALGFIILVTGGWLSLLCCLNVTHLMERPTDVCEMLLNFWMDV